MNDASAVALRWLGLRDGAAAGWLCGWRRVEDTGPQVARFAPQPYEETGVPGDNDEDHSHLAALRLIAHGTPPGHAAPLGPFELEHSLGGRTCAVNGEPLPPGRRVPLRAGDEVQLGLLRLGFVAPHREEDWPALLAPIGHDEARAAARSDDDIATFGATAASNFGVRDAWADAPGAADGPDAARPAGEAQTSAGDDGDTVLGELHRRYHATLIDPGAMGSEAPGRHDAVGTDAAVAPGARAFDALVSQSRPDDSLHDLLVAPDAMDTLIARADALGEGDLLRDERVESVLHLFAPTAHRGLAGNDEEFEALLGKTSAKAPPDSLSSLTRREHHLTGADSALRLGGTSSSMVHANAPSAPEPGEVGHG